MMAIILRFVSCIVFFHFLLTFDFLLYINAFSLFSAFSVFIIWINFFFISLPLVCMLYILFLLDLNFNLHTLIHFAKYSDFWQSL